MADRLIGEAPWMRVALTLAALAVVTLFLVLPLVTVLIQALDRGLGAYLAALAEPDAVAAIRLTLLVAALAVPLNTAFGLAAAWALTKNDVPGRRLLLSLIELPFAVSP